MIFFMAKMLQGIIEEKSFLLRGCGNGMEYVGPSSLLPKFFNHCVTLGFILSLMCMEKLWSYSFFCICPQEKALMHATAWDCMLGYNVRCRLGKMIIKPKHNPVQFLSGNL